jgi:putative pyruvate formate lyase activating enzyme
MHRQVGVARIDEKGIIRKGVIIRHLVLPNNISGSGKIMKFIAEELSKETYISLMSQYLPCYKADKLKEIYRRITFEEYNEAKAAMEKYGLYNGWTQDGRGLERFAGVNIKSILNKNANT